MNDIRNIIFDLGNVLLDFDIRRSQQRFHELVGEEAQKANQRLSEEGFYARYETGAFSEQTFLETLRDSVSNGKSLSLNQIAEAWNAMLIGMPPHRFEWLEKLRSKYRIFLLSNSNATHFRWIFNHFEQDHGITDFNTRFFEKTYYSHQLGMRKPDATIFQHVLNDAGIEMHETLFIDDLAPNVEAAKELGIKALLHDDGRDVTEVLFA